MSVDSGSAAPAARLGIKPGMVVQELGWDEDADEELRDAIVEVSGSDMVDEDTDEVADVVVFLCSPRSVAVNGDAVAVGGGAVGAIHY